MFYGETMTRRLKAWSGVGAAVLLAAVLMLPAAAGFGADRDAASFADEGIVLPPRPAWSPQVDLGIRDLATDGGGRLLAAIGDFERAGYFGAARFSSGGVIQAAFGKGGYTPPLHVHHGPGLRLRARAITPQGSAVIVAGYQETELGGTAPLLARYQSNGALDRTFGHRGVIAPKPATEGKDPSDPTYGLHGGGVLQDAAVQPGGPIIAVGGRNEEGGGHPAALVIAYRRDGGVDSGFADGGRLVMPMARENLFTGFTSVEILPDRKVLVAGYLRGALALLRLTADGELDRSFGGGDGIVTPQAGQPRYCCPTPALLGVTGNGWILVGGAADRAREEPLLLFRLRPDGSTDRSFGTKGHIFGRPQGNATSTFIPFALTVQQNGRMVVAGVDERVERERRVWPAFTVLRYLADGKVDRSFGKGGVEMLPSSQAGGGVAATVSGGAVVVGGGTYSRASKGSRFRPVLTRYKAGS